VAELLVTFTEPVRSSNGDLYYVRAMGGVAKDGLWQGWLDFVLAGSEETVTTSRETTQPNRDDLMYWAEGLSATYLEGALDRALSPQPAAAEPVPHEFVSSAPRSTRGRSGGSVPARVVLDPFQVYAEGEELLRGQLGALSHDHLQNIVEIYQFTNASDPDWARTASNDALVERIVERVRDRFAVTPNAAGRERAAEGDRQTATGEDRHA
jgi:hypothetical protein